MNDNQEIYVCIKEVHPWGITVSVDGDDDVFLDNTKISDLRTSGALPVQGKMMIAVVIDSTRLPVRVSALPEDIGIARTLHEREGV